MLVTFHKDANDSFHVRHGTQIDHVNGLQLLTAKPVIYLVNLSERDYVRKKNKWLPKIKAWIDEKNPGACLIVGKQSGGRRAANFCLPCR